MQTDRTPRASFGAVSTQALIEYLRIDAADLAEAQDMASAAAAEIEAYTGLALLTQEIVATTDEPVCDRILALPVGPVLPGAVATLEVVEEDGTTTPVTSGFWLEAGRYPRLRFAAPPPAGRLRITYEAGYGDDHFAVPVDLAQAVLAQTAALYDQRGSCGHGRMVNSLAPATARIAARYRRVAL
jgi:uncharacterized phiE125 gp8 family phage protein